LLPLRAYWADARLQRQLATVPANRSLPASLVIKANLPPAHPALVAANLVHLRGESPNPIRRQSEENCNAFFVWKTA
jgi:hydrogenase nickel insertion protein hypA